MKKFFFTLIFLFLINVLPLLFKPELLLSYKVIIIFIAGIVIFLTQPAFSFEETVNNKATDRFSILMILLASGISISASLVEWAYFSNRHSNIYFTILGVIMIITGLLFRIISIKTLGKYFTATARITQQHKLIKSGPYSIVRHPSYTGAIIAMIGTPVLLNDTIMVVLTVLLLAAAYYVRIKHEEKLLVAIFGESYIQYSSNVKKIIPFIW